MNRRKGPSVSVSLVWVILTFFALAAAALLFQGASRADYIASHSFWLPLAGGMIAGAFLGLTVWKRRRQNHRLERIRQSLETLALGNLDARLPVWNDDSEADRICHEVNMAMVQLQTVLAERMLALARSFDHEFGYSALDLRGRVSQILAPDGNPSTDAIAALAVMEAEQKRFMRLTEGIRTLYLARQGGETRYEEDFADIVDQSLDSQDNGAKHITLQRDIPPAIKIIGNAPMLTLMTTMLLGNALKYTPKNGVVAVSCRLTGNDVQLIIEDSGPGIKPDERELVFKEGYRVKATMHEPGDGHGLAVVKAIILRHQGSVEIDESYLGGARFCVSLPLPPDA